MLIDVQDPSRNLVLNGCFLAILFLALMALIPWRHLGVKRVGDWLRWLVIPVFVLAFIYELTMPPRFDIRIDLIILLPAYLIVAVTSIARWCARRSLVKGGREGIGSLF